IPRTVDGGSGIFTAAWGRPIAWRDRGAAGESCHRGVQSVLRNARKLSPMESPASVRRRVSSRGQFDVPDLLIYRFTTPHAAGRVLWEMAVATGPRRLECTRLYRGPGCWERLRLLTVGDDGTAPARVVVSPAREPVVLHKAQNNFGA